MKLSVFIIAKKVINRIKMNKNGLILFKICYNV